MATTWAKARRVVERAAFRARSWLELLGGSQTVGRLRATAQHVGSLAVRAQTRAAISHVVHSVQANGASEPVVSRYALHLVVVCLAVGIVVISQIRIPRIGVLWPVPTQAPEVVGSVVTETLTGLGAGRANDASVALLPVPVAHTTASEWERREVITYTVQTNDNLWAISQRFGLQVETLLWANASVETDPDLLSVDQVLVIPPVDGVYYTVQKGDTVDKLAKKFKTTAEQIVSFKSNGLEQPYTLVAGQKLMIPGGKKPVPVYQSIYPMTRVGTAPKGAPTGTGRFAWPTRGTLTQRYWSMHAAIDIANRTGTPIYAADAGYVVMAGQDTWGYGNQVVIDHGNGYWTRYAHLDRILVTAGDAVKKNQKIGTMGNTGRSTGSHLHFEVIYKRTQRNPLSYLP